MHLTGDRKDIRPRNSFVPAMPEFFYERFSFGRDQAQFKVTEENRLNKKESDY